MVKVRLARFGRKNRPFYRIVATNSREKRDGRFLENLGWYDPLQKDVDRKVKLNQDRYSYWLSVGAQPTETLRILLAHVKAAAVAPAATPAPKAPAPKKPRKAKKPKPATSSKKK